MSEFKVGDRVKYVGKDDRYLELVGEIEYLWENDKIVGVDVGEELPYEFFIGNLELYEEKEEIEENKKLITLDELLERIEKLEKEVFKPVEIHDRPEETKSSLLTEDERVILRNLVKKWKWIARDEVDCLRIFKDKPYREKGYWRSLGNHEFLDIFNHLFCFIGLLDDEPYNIEELLKGECGNDN